MRFLSYLVTLLSATLIAACGGGGGSPGLVTGPQALAVIAPAGLIQLVGTAESFAITGGKAPFSARSNNELVAVAGVSDGTLTIFTVGVGTATITVRDSFGATVDVPLTSAVAQPLSTTAGSATTVEVGATQRFRVVGGAPGYTGTSANPNIAFAFVSDDTLTITGITPGTTNVVVRDGVGSTVSIAVTVTTVGNRALFTTAASPLNVPINTSVQFSVGGGVPFSGSPLYTVANSSPGIVSTSISNNMVTVTGLAVGSATIAIRDSVGTAVNVAVTVPSPGAVFTTAPASGVTIGVGSFEVFDIGGGLGPFTVTSSNTALVTAVKTSSTTVKISAIAAGSASVVVRDSLGSIATIQVTVPAPVLTPLTTTAPAGLTIAINSSPTFLISGGTPGYSVESSNTAVATGTISGSTTLVVHGVAAGSAVLVVRDAVGATVNVPVTVAGSSVALFTSAPSPVTVPLNTTSTFSVGGGTGIGYTAVSSNPAVATATLSGTVSGSNLLVHGVSPGSAIINIRDSGGGLVALTVNVPSVANQALFTSAPTSVTIAVGSPQTYIVSGGTSPYLITSDNTTVATVSPESATSTYTISGVTAGTANVQIRDSAGQVLSVGVTVVTSGAVPLATTAPSAVSVAINTTQTYSIVGGTGPYSFTNTNPSIATATVSGSGPGGGTLTIHGVLIGTTTITVFDGVGASVVIPVTVIQPGTTLVVLPATLSVSELNSSQINLTISGGTPGTGYLAFTDNQVLSQLTVVGSTLEVRVGSQGTRCVPATTTVNFTVVDAVGATAKSALTIVDNGFCLTP